MGNEISLDQTLFDLKITAKQLAQTASKCEKEERAQKLRVKMAITKNNMDAARIYGENAIRNRNEAINFLRLSSRIEAVAFRVETAIRLQKVSLAMRDVVRGMDQALHYMNLEQVSKLMDRFEKTFEDLDVQSAVMEESMMQQGQKSTPAEQVDELIAQVAEEHGLELGEAMENAKKSREEKEDELVNKLPSV